MPPSLQTPVLFLPTSPFVALFGDLVAGNLRVVLVLLASG
ncbi:hypothetical protein A2U01_0115799, partial [Trifolium medium]|nr:hypothetical protein [Trifolium medium]